MDEPSNPYLPLLSRTAQGDEGAFAQLYRATSGKLYAVSLQMLHRQDWAEDVVQEAFVRIWHNAGEYQSEKGTVLSWMISIARYRALDMLRAAKSRRETSEEEGPTQEDPHSPEVALYQKRERADIDDCMDLLEGSQRHAIHLAYFLGLTHFEVCNRLASPLGSVKSWIRRGLERLKRCLEP
ncbi:sigma-70 family RNA polymerase sigma factor [Marinimicrobium agarilyticum]|uniref:sigma-70 family RNA polymerase sigma factor n=1 Tax=Marinimicrobium agarilyticum TaxID=306546 RepID=UPI000428413B|nr:sigma-70 family RNA polymerase sigma factor [Marinimicrobium agarilyticum]